MEGLLDGLDIRRFGIYIQDYGAPGRDPFFTVEGARAYLRDQPDAELQLLPTGHFALEEELERIAGLIRAFYATRVHPAALAADH